MILIEILASRENGTSEASWEQLYDACLAVPFGARDTVNEGVNIVIKSKLQRWIKES